MSAQRRAMNADGRFLGVVAILVNQTEPARLGEINLIGRKRELASDYAPDLHIDLRPVKRGLVSHFNIVDSGVLQHVSRHLLGLFPKLRFADKLLSEL